MIDANPSRPLARRRSLVIRGAVWPSFHGQFGPLVFALPLLLCPPCGQGAMTRCSCAARSLGRGG